MTEVIEKTVVIKPATKIKFSGVSSYTNTRTTIEGAQIGKGGSYKTGLTPKEEEEFCEKLGLPKGTLNKNNGAFWGHVLDLSLPMDKPYMFTIASDMDELKLKVLLNHDLVANNELDLSKNPKAQFFIEDKEAKAKMEELVIDLNFEASEAFYGLANDERKGYLKLYGKTGVDTMSEKIIKTELYKEVTKDPKKFLDFVRNPDVSLRIEIQDMLESGAIKRKGSYYQFEDEVIGTSIDSIVAFFKDVKNQSIKIAAKSKKK